MGFRSATFSARYSGTARATFSERCLQNSGSPIRDALLDMIRSAKQRIFVASFMIGDEEVIAELLKAANRLRGGVYVITALDERSLRRGAQEYDVLEQEAPEERRKNFERLTTNGIYVRGHESCHAKFAVIDETIAIAGSANFVKNGFESTGEADLVVRNPTQVRQLGRLFTELWYEGCLWEVSPGRDYVVAERKGQESPMRPDRPDGSPGEVVWTNESDQAFLLQAIHDVVEGATEHLTLSTYSLVGMKDNPSLLFEPIGRALQRGVAVRLFIRQRNAWPEQMKELLAAHDMGVTIYGDHRNHAKMVIADDQRAVLFSANLDANHGLDSGVEVGIRVDDQAAVRELTRYINHAIGNAGTRFVSKPTVRELDGRLVARWCSAWPLEDELNVHCPRAAFERFAERASSGPCLYEEYAADKFRIYAGQAVMEVSLRDGLFGAGVTSSEESLSARNQLEMWLTSVRRDRHTPALRRGFCPATLILKDAKEE